MATDFTTAQGTNTVYVDGLVINDATAAYWRTTTYAPGAFDGGTANARGDHDGTSDPTTLFSVTGVVEMWVIGVVSADLTGNATIEVGVAGNTAGLLAQVDNQSAQLVEDDVWTNASTAQGVLANELGASSIVASDVIETIAAANLTAGEITYYCIWRAISSDGAVTAGS